MQHLNLEPALLLSQKKRKKNKKARFALKVHFGECGARPHDDSARH